MFAFEAHVIESLTRKHRRPPLDLAALAAARREGTSGGAGARDTWRDPVREKDTCQESVGQSGKRDERDEGARVSGEAVAVEENPTEGSFGEGISDGVAEGFRDGNPAGSDGSRRGDSRGERSEAEHETGAEVRSGGAEGSSSRERLQDISALQAEGSVSRERLQDMSALQAVSGEGLEGSASHERVQGSVQPRSEDNNISDTLEGAGPREQSADLRQPDAEGGPREAEGSAAHERPQVAAELQTEAELESDRVRTGDWLSPTSKERATGRMKEFEYERQARAGREEGDRGHDAWQQEAGVSSVDDGAQEGEDGRRLSEGGAGPRTVVPAETDERSGSEKWISDSLEVVGMVREGSGYGVGHSRTKARVHVNGKVATGGIEWWPIGVGNGQTQQSGPAHSQRKDGKGRRNDWTGSDKSAGVAERGASNTIPVRDVQADHRT